MAKLRSAIALVLVLSLPLDGCLRCLNEGYMKVSGVVKAEQFGVPECQLRLEDQHHELIDSRQIGGPFDEEFVYSVCAIPVAAVVQCDSEVVLRKNIEKVHFGDEVNLGTIVRFSNRALMSSLC